LPDLAFKSLSVGASEFKPIAKIYNPNVPEFIPTIKAKKGSLKVDAEAFVPVISNSNKPLEVFN
jgi:hypothetical protein